jgi:hypothetical protein
MARIEAPFSPEQVLMLKAWQEGNKTFKMDLAGDIIYVPAHPFTCCGHEGCKRSEREDDGVLVPTELGWTCPCGKYKQYWCHDFMVDQKSTQDDKPGTDKDSQQ